MAPGSTTIAWIGFRAPIVPATNRLYTLIVPVLNFDVLAISDSTPGLAAFGDPIELDFQGRGIRSFEGDTNGYLIITGPPSNIPTPIPPYDYKMYSWSGNPADPPRQHAADFTGLNPEALVELPPHPWTEASQFQILSDNGRTDYYNDGTQGKHLPEPNFKKFRSDIITLGPVVRPQPFFTSITQTDGITSLQWRATIGDTYRIQYKTLFTDPDWMDLPGDITATGPLAATSDAVNAATQRFYKVTLLP
jgi:hypothetical protein